MTQATSSRNMGASGTSCATILEVLSKHTYQHGAYSVSCGKFPSVGNAAATVYAEYFLMSNTIVAPIEVQCL